MKKILIIYATAGVGHAKAAFAVKKAFDEVALQDVRVVLIDSLTYMTSYFRKSYLSYYLLMITRLSNIWGFFYFVTNNYFVYQVVKFARRYMNWLHSRAFVRYLKNFDADVIISTHFLANEVISNLKSKGLLRAKLITVITDYRLHSFWVAPNIDCYVVGSEEAKADLRKFHVKPGRVHVFGIPVEPVFGRPSDRQELLRTFGLEADRSTILVVGGGFGIGPIEQIVKILDAAGGERLQSLVICGYNEALRRRIDAMRHDLGMPVKAYGFVNNMHEFMTVSDFLISKSGGLTATEALVKDLPLVIIAPIPGQESRNSDFLVAHGAAVKVKRVGRIRGLIESFIADPGELARMKDAIKKVARPRSAFDIVDLALERKRGVA